MLKICLDRNPKSRLLPEDILKSFFYNNKLEELIPFLEDDQETDTNEFTLNFVKFFLEFNHSYHFKSFKKYTKL